MDGILIIIGIRCEQLLQLNAIGITIIPENIFWAREIVWKREGDAPKFCQIIKSCNIQKDVLIFRMKLNTAPAK